MMKKYIFIAVVAFGTTLLQAQGLTGRAIYRVSLTGVSAKEFEKSMQETDKIPEELKEQVIAKYKKQMTNYFELSFDRKQSLYQEKKTLDAPSLKQGGVIVETNDMDSKYYKNFKEKKVLNAVNLGGKQFLITSKLPSVKWKLSDETKKIGRYTCRKATQTIKVKRNVGITVIDKNSDEEESEMPQMETINATIIAWYTVQIPVMTGPELFGGLPGLILELHTMDHDFLCTEITLNPKKSVKIKPLKKGKKVTSAEFEEITKKHFEEIRQRSEGRTMQLSM